MRFALKNDRFPKIRGVDFPFPVAIHGASQKPSSKRELFEMNVLKVFHF